MANWDFVFAYDAAAADWLARQGLPCPLVRPGNRLPNTSEMRLAWRAVDPNRLLEVDNFDWDTDAYIPKDVFKLRGNRLIGLLTLIRLCETCGQLWLYPDTGEPAIVVDKFTDANRALRLHKEAIDVANGWENFYVQMYSPQPNNEI